jgi:hypothetical protein
MATTLFKAEAEGKDLTQTTTTGDGEIPQAFSIF